MEGLSNAMLGWMFGEWIFDGADGSAPGMPAATPLIIFAGLFSTVGLAFIGLLGAWTAFLGIFRLRQNGNFFSASNPNEAFFYPLRLVAAMALCAPVIPISSAGNSIVTLTPGHALIAGIAKTASAAGDELQAKSFRIMNDYNLYHDPSFVIKVSSSEAKEQFKTWFANAVIIASSQRQRNPEGEADMIAADFAQGLLEAQWKESFRLDSPLAFTGSVDHFISSMAKQFSVPLIPPTDEIAKQGGSGVSSSVLEGTMASDIGSEGMICRWGANWVCSDEYKSARTQNDQAIKKGIAQAQRDAWEKIVEYAFRHADAHNSMSMTKADMDNFLSEEAEYISYLSKWYSETTSKLIRDNIASAHSNKASDFYDEMESWGWMAGSSFVLRAASDFSRMQSYSSGANSLVLPDSALSDLTTGETMTKMAHESAINNLSQKKEMGKESLFNSFFSLEFISKPENMNLSTITAWGRSLAGTGIGVLAGSSIFKVVDNPVVKGIAVALIVVGSILGYILPVMFVIYGVFGVIAWLTFVMSSFYGVTIWAAAQAAPKGEEHSSQMAAKGWNILAFIGLYPMLSAGGLAAAVVIMNIGLPFVGIMMSGILGMFDPGTAELGKPLDHLAGVLLGGAVTIIVYAILCWSVCVTSAQLITTFPRTVLNMISLGEPALNPYENVTQSVGTQVGGSLQRVAVGAAMTKVSGGISRLVASTRQGGGSGASGG